MKQFASLILLTVVGSAVGFAAPCADGTLATYIGLGASGCTIGSNTLYDFQLPSGTTGGATEISASLITVTPGGGSTNPGLTFTVTESANANTLLEALFGYQIAGGSYSSDSITLSGSSETVDGAVTDIQNYCAGGAFLADGFSGCGGTTGTLLTLDGVQNSDSTSLLPVALIGITDDLTFDGGTAGSAAGGVITDGFTAGAVSAVPEPSSALLAGLGVALAARLKMKGRKA